MFEYVAIGTPTGVPSSSGGTISILPAAEDHSSACPKAKTPDEILDAAGDLSDEIIESADQESSSQESVRGLMPGQKVSASSSDAASTASARRAQRSLQALRYASYTGPQQTRF